MTKRDRIGIWVTVPLAPALPFIVYARTYDTLTAIGIMSAFVAVAALLIKPAIALSVRMEKSPNRHIYEAIPYIFIGFGWLIFDGVAPGTMLDILAFTSVMLSFFSVHELRKDSQKQVLEKAEDPTKSDI